MVSSQVQYYVKSSNLKKKKHLEGHGRILHSGEEYVVGLYCALIF